jgi:superfamily II DNA or RNA helicase
MPRSNGFTDDSTAPEDLFVELFVQVFGLECAQALSREFPFSDIYGKKRRIDFALKTKQNKIAFEVDGLAWHHPAEISVLDYEDQLLRQNSLIAEGWQIYRWTDREISSEPDRVKDELARFLENVPGLLDNNEFLPRQQIQRIELRDYQQDALQQLAELRHNGKSIAVIDHATGAGKTIVAIHDAKLIGGRTLYIAHRRNLIEQTRNVFLREWPEKTAILFVPGESVCDAHNVMASMQSLAKNLNHFKPDDFDYIIIDEAHHAPAASYEKILEYFSPRFTIGLTATLERLDGQSVLEIFQNKAHRLSLEEAVKLGHLVPIRCFRVHTNIDLSRVRYNRIQYNRQELERKIQIPTRDQLIVDTYRNNVAGRRTVIFCVTVRHGELVAEKLTAAGFPARAISGRMSSTQQQTTLCDFRSGKIFVLCACDILNEGWDCPEVEVLFMARPTLSKVIYMQQLGRGTRKAPGKESLLVFDFVDSTSRYNVSINLHRVLGRKKYRPGSLILATDAQMEQEKERWSSGELPNAVVDIGLWVRSFEEIDLFNWQEMRKNCFSSVELELELCCGSGLVRRATLDGRIQADHKIEIGESCHFFYDKERTEDIRETLDLPMITTDNIFDVFLDFVVDMNMASSYKPVFLLSMLDRVNKRGVALLKDVVDGFRDFYAERNRQGKTVEKRNNRMKNFIELSFEEISGIVLQMPFEKFERRRFMKYDRDLAYIRFEYRLWRKVTPALKEKMKQCCQEALCSYYRD